MGIKNLAWKRNEYGSQCITARGEKVKSWAEKIIADYFTSCKIKYVYEQPAQKHLWILETELCRPDFFLPDYNVYVEYWGLVDVNDPDLNSKYERNMRWKMAQYYKNKIKFVSLYPSNLDNLDRIFKNKLREVTGILLPFLAMPNSQSKS